MTSILDRVAGKFPPTNYSYFRPANQREFFALRLAHKLNDAGAARHYAELVEHHSESRCLVAYRRAKVAGSHADPARSFHQELARLGTREFNGTNIRKLAAIRIERRSVAVVILAGEHIAYPPLVRQLSSDSDKALASSAGFITQVLEKCPFETAVLEVIPDRGEVQRTQLNEIINRVLVEQTVSIWQIPKADILEAYGYPPLRFRKQVREVISELWPGVNGTYGGPLIKDALALGLYAHNERHFNQ